MKTTKMMKSFVKEFVALVKGDDATATAEKVLRRADAALRSQIGALEGESVRLEDIVMDAQEGVQKALFNNGTLISSGDDYVENLYNAENKLLKAQEVLDKHNKKINFLKKKLEEINTEVTE
jgi:DNA repair ATPase RecN